MAGANIKLGVEYSQFKRGMKEAQESVKTLTEKLKQNESQLKLTGDKELYLKNKVDLLNEQIKAQRQVVANAKSALDALAKSGVDKASTQYQQMERNVYKASDQLNKMQLELRNVESGADKAGDEAGQMNTELQKVGKGVAWDNVTNGLDSIIGKLESGARAAVNFGKKVISSAKGSTEWADELITLSKQTGIDMTTLQQMQKVAEFVDTDVDAILNAQQRMKVATQSAGGKTAIEEVLGISLNGQSADDLFWEVGDALVNMGEAFDKDAAAQKVFGRSWKELMPLFLTGREEYEKMLGEQNTLTDEQVQKLGQADDAIKQVEQQIQDLKNTFWAENADKITDLMQWFVDNKDAVVAALTAIGAAFGGLKLGSFALNLQKTVSEFQKLGLAKSAGDAAGAAGGTAGGTGGGAGLLSSLGLDGLLGLGGLVGIPAAFAKAIDQRRNHAEQVRGTDENFAANTAGVESLLRDWITSNRQYDEMEFTASEAELAALQNKITEAYQQLSESEEGLKALRAYSDWRQENAYGSYDWELPESLDKMNQVAGETSEGLAGVQQSNTDMTQAAKELSAMPEAMGTAVETAVENGMSKVTIVLGADAVQAISDRIAAGWGGRVFNMVK